MGGNDDAGDAGTARYACEERVKNSLKSPSTADFSGVTTTGSGPYSVTGDVDSQNGFGAMVRSSFSCSVRMTDDTAYTTVEYIR